MKDDDLDLDLDDEPVKAERRPAPSPAPAKTPAKPAEPQAAPAAKPTAPAQPVGERRGLLRGLGDSIGWIRDFRWNIRTFLSLLIALIVLVVLIENWVPVRFYALGFAFEMPRTVTFVIDLVIGALLMWLWLRRPSRGAEGGQ
ncbi:hypothetical protein LLH23_18355 [bacterium]|nr:hypothetical protein [bacterium]